MRKLIKSILLEVGVENLKIRPRGDNRCESAKSVLELLKARQSPSLVSDHATDAKVPWFPMKGVFGA